MIARLKGIIADIKPTEIILDVQGVGYHVSIPLSTYDKISGQQEVVLHIFTLHREDTMRLFGFYTEQEKALFSLLLNISGIGPAMALSILSGISVQELIETVHSQDTAALLRIPGIGKSKAEKLIFELQRKSKNFASISTGQKRAPSLKSDALEALTSLGFDEKKAIPLIDRLLKENPGSSLEALVKQALREFSA